MTLLHKIIIGVLAIALVCFALFMGFKYIELNKKLQHIEQSFTEQKQLLDNISRAQSHYASKEDIESFAKLHNINLDVIKKDLDQLDARIQGINNVTVVSQGQTSSNLPSTSTTPRVDSPPIDSTLNPHGYLTNTQHLQLNENFSNVSVPIGKVSFSAFRANPWDIDIKTRKYSVISVLGMNEEGKHYSYSKFAVQIDDKNYDVQISDNKFIEEYPANKFYWWNPRANLMIGAGVTIVTPLVQGNVTPALTVGVLSYGRTKINPLLSLGQIGLGYGMVSKNVEFIFAPIQYNIGNDVSFIRNTYIGPTVQVNTSGNITVAAALSVGL